jgi:hypothetical protein
MLLTLGQVKLGPVGRSCGIATNKPDFANYVNDAARQLIIRGNWWATVHPMILTVAWSPHPALICPREVESILAVNEHYHAEVKNFWYKFVPWNDEFRHWFDDFIGGDSVNWRHHHKRVAYNIGTTPVYNQINPSQPMYVRATSNNVADVGINVSIFGVDGSGNPAQATLTLAVPPGQTYPMASSATTSVQFGRIDRVVKDLSNGYITCQQDDNNGNLLPLSVYQPSEQTPEYTVMKLDGFGHLHHALPFISVVAKLAFIPALADTDNVLIENQDALRDMVLSIRKKEAGDVAGAAQYESSAIHELNRDMETRFPDEQFVVEYFQNSTPQRRRIF